MKKLTLLICAAFIFTACATLETEPPETTNSTTTVITETTTKSTTTTPVSEEQVFTDAEIKTTTYKALDGSMVDISEATLTEHNSIAEFPFAYLRKSVGIFDTSRLHPELFDIENRDYFGKEYDWENGDYQKVQTGDKFGGLTVKNAVQETYTYTLNREKTDPEFQKMDVRMAKIQFDGTITLKGVLWRAKKDDAYIIENDIRLYPYSITEGDFPFAFACNSIVFPIFICDIDDNFGLYSDNKFLTLGSSHDYEINFDEMFSKENYIDVEITLDELVVQCSENAPLVTRAKIVSVKEM